MACSNFLWKDKEFSTLEENRIKSSLVNLAVGEVITVRCYRWFIYSCALVFLVVSMPHYSASSTKVSQQCTEERFQS